MMNETFPPANAALPDSLTSAVLELGPRLAETRAVIESRFSATGDSLIECAMSLNAVSAAHEGLPGALDGEEFAQAEASLASISAELARISHSDVGEDGAIAQLQKLAVSMADPLIELRRVMLLLEIISANVGILAAEISDESGELEAFTGAMVALAHGAIDGIAAFAQSRAALLSQLSGATAAKDRFAAIHADTLEHVRSRLEGHAEAIARHRHSAGRQLSDNGGATRRIAERVASVVSAMQIGDITRQRIEHVEQGLDVLIALLRPDNSEAPALRAATVGQLRRLEEAQLRDAVSEFREQAKFIAESLPQLADDTERVLADGDAQARALTASSGDTLAGMLADLHKVRSLFADFRSVHDEAHRLAQAVAAAIENMVSKLGTIDRIERRIRMLSFNMAAQCTRLGAEGRAMMVITEQLRDLAMRTETAAGQVHELLAAGTQCAATIASGNDRGTELARLDGATSDTIERIEAVKEEMGGHARTLAERGPGALAILRHAAMAARSLDDVAGQWDAALVTIGECGGAPDVEGEIDPAPFMELRRGYTMHSERRIHDEICGDAQAGDAPCSTDDADHLDEDPLAALF